MASYEAKRSISDFDVHKTGTQVYEIENIFPYSFVPVQRDPLSRLYGKTMHSDGAGSKTIWNYLHWKETGNSDVFEWIPDDIAAMNLDDIFCVTAESEIDFVDYVAINRFRVPKELFSKHLNNGFRRVFGILERCDIRVNWYGGETAELADQVRTVDVSGAVHARFRLRNAVTGERVRPDDVIIGLGSHGKAVWEGRENSGNMSNGLTVERHCLLTPDYVIKYPEIADPEFMEYRGRFRTDQYINELRMTLGEAALSPTRIFAPILKVVIEKYGKDVHAVVHNTGGGLTKSLRVGKDIHYVKGRLPKPPYLVSLVKKESGRSWRSIYEGLCNGIGIEIICPEKVAPHIMEDIDKVDVPVSMIGHCEANTDKEKMASKHGNRVTIISEHGTFEYPYEKID